VLNKVPRYEEVLGGVEVQIHAFFTSKLVGHESSDSPSGRLTPGKSHTPRTHWIGR